MITHCWGMRCSWGHPSLDTYGLESSLRILPHAFNIVTTQHPYPFPPRFWLASTSTLYMSLGRRLRLRISFSTSRAMHYWPLYLCSMLLVLIAAHISLSRPGHITLTVWHQPASTASVPPPLNIPPSRARRQFALRLAQRKLAEDRASAAGENPSDEVADLADGMFSLRSLYCLRLCESFTPFCVES